jgi:CAAX protease family protein
MRERTLPFFIVALGVTWLLQLPAVLAQRGLIPGPVERFMLPVGLGAFGPLVAAVLVSRFESGGAGVRALFRPLGIWRVGWGWYVVALGLFAAIYVAGTAVYTLLGGTAAGPWFYPPENGQQIAAMIVFPLAEEPGWRGFALPRLQRRYGAVKASLLLGVAWALWHTMMFILQGASAGTFSIMMVNIVLASLVFGWLYNRTQGSLLLAILLHVGAHLSNPTHSLPAKVVPFVIYTVAMGVAACALLLRDRVPTSSAPRR